MLTAFILLAAMDAASTPTSTPAPVTATANGQTRTLADVARERKLGKKGARGGTLSVSGAPVSGASVPQGGPAEVKPAAGADAEEAAWRQRSADARTELAAAQAALGQAEAALPIINVGTRPNAANVILKQNRDAALLPYRTRVSDAQARVNALPEEARKAGAAPGWVR